MKESLQRIAQTYAFDARSLALMRILVGMGFVFCRLINLPHVREFYTDQGSYPRVMAAFLPSLLPSFPSGGSLFHAVGTDAGVFFLYFLTIAAGLALIVGYKTRQATLCCWVLGMSLYNRCPIINPASDAEILLCMFFGFFLPWGDMWSVDNPNGPDHGPEGVTPYHSAATIGWRVQVSALYITAAFSKTSFHWGNGTASFVSMNSDAWSSFIGRWIARMLEPHPALSRDLTGFVVLLEFVLPFMLLIPVIRLQFLGVIGLALMHVTFGLALHLEAFSPLAIACLSGFIPAFVWNRHLSGLERWLSNRPWAGRAPTAQAKPLPALEGRFGPMGPFSSAFVAWATIGLVWTCGLSTKSFPIPLTERAAEPWHVFGVKQTWGMFVPPPYQGGYYVFRGKTARGEWVNLELYGDSADSLSLPAQIDQTVPTSRHVLLYNTIIVKSKPMKPIHEKIAKNFRIRWELSHPATLDRLISVELYKFYREYDCDKGTFSKAELMFTWKTQS